MRLDGKVWLMRCGDVDLNGPNYFFNKALI